MLYLSIAICSNALMFLLLKHYDRHGHSKRAVLLVNYITASLIGVFLCWENGIFDQMDSLSLAGSLQALLGNFRGKLSAQGSMLWALILGTIAGGFCFAALALIQIRIGKEDAGIVSMFTKLGILVPVILSIFIWAELPSPLQWIGIALAVISIVVANLEPTDVKKINIGIPARLYAGPVHGENWMIFVSAEFIAVVMFQFLCKRSVIRKTTIRQTVR